ncbi:MAG: bifunctional [glutamate--ammonia ligase]-adenylyl-L-tyrosine phosphorylase/[glutamate--ammonia-ligase] adenylyltransferase [Mariprofundus sp.]|nr:bifunctional [glutamate--ammonia ligase]-adenylyl-L-tyrosine phosphorylase/[glutamate--ammonia-ligase] adenylyltransferase [Mariprofundus sp.]
MRDSDVGLEAWLMQLPAAIGSEAERLLAISPLFTTLMRKANDEERQHVCVDLTHVRLPDDSDEWIPACDSIDLITCMQHLRQCKQRGHRHLIWWELGLHGDMDVSYRSIADFAAGLLNQALSMAERLIGPRYGYLDGGSFCVIGLGKLGGHELNLGSDVDPLFVWQGSGVTTGGRQAAPAAEYYMHLSRMLIRLMSDYTAEGIVWPVDMRLRPGGDGAAIALSLEMTLSHYLEYGQTWERAMLIKARPVAGDLALGQALVEGIAPFIYRRYLDYTTVAALADMKRRIDGQAGRGGIAPGFDVKRGRGGIREIEFTIQSLQLLHGGRNAALRVQPSMAAIKGLLQADLMSVADMQSLQSAYLFWRRVEHAIQGRRGEQTHKLPEDYADYLTAATGMAQIERQMVRHAAIVEDIFAHFIKPVGDEGELQNSYLSGKHDELDSLPEPAGERMHHALAKINECLLRGLLPERSRGQVECILAQAMVRWLDDENGVVALESFADLIHAIAGRATWIDLLATHQGALNWLIGVLSASRYLADHIVKEPSWLEWPLLVEYRDTGVSEVYAALEALNQFDDVEQALAEIGRSVDRVRLLSALAVDAHTADAMTMGGWLADIADAATRATLRLCLHEMALPADFPFVALAMGKHGSREMGLVSDLDMVFVLAHDEPSMIMGRRSIGEHGQRLGRRMIQYLSAKPPFGAGFEFDARLRPSGCSGVLVTTIAGFQGYQLKEAHTWEHQALCRARTVAGPVAACAAVEAVVLGVLNQPRDGGLIAHDVMVMRQKMMDHLCSRSETVINLKQDRGGLVDIEFLGQYARLIFGGSGRKTVDILNALPHAAPAIWRAHGGWLADTYLDYRQMENALRVELWRSIGKLPNDHMATEWETMRRHAGITSPEQLLERMSRVRQVFQQLLA